MRRISRSSSILWLLVILAFPAEGRAQNCRKGKPCGNTCIARDKVCHVGAGTARWAPGADSTTTEPPVTAKGIVGPTSACSLARITDGDTIECTDGRRARLLLIDDPESDQGDFGRTATDYLRRLVPPRTVVTLESDLELRDRYGRDLAYVWLPDGRLVNEALARAGMVLVLSYPPNVRHIDRIRAAVAEAQQAKRALWATSAFACTPVDHRAGKC